MSTRRNTRSRSKRRQRSIMSNSVIVIDDSDDDAPGETDLDLKPAAKPSAVNDPPCISLLDSPDEEIRRGMSPNRKKRKLASKREAADRELAEKLQRQENLATMKASAMREKKEMVKSSDGKAVLAVQEIVALVESAKEKYMNKPGLRQYCVETVTIDDMVFFAKNMLDLQQEFIQKQLPGYIDVGYHYTDQRNMADIRTHGLLTKNERENNKVKALPKGSVFGDGIYTANNGTCFSNYGDTGLLVGRLKGKMVRVARSLPPNQTVDANTIIGDKLLGATQFGKPVGSDGWPSDDSFHEIVLRSCSQCLPILKFDRGLRQNQVGKECVRYLKKSLQEILNRLFNKGLPGSVFRSAPLITGALNPNNGLPPNLPVFPPAAAGPAAAAPKPMSRAVPFVTNTTAPFNPSMPPHTRRTAPLTSTRSAHSVQTTLNYTAPRNLTTGIPSNALRPPPRSCNMKEKCVICHEVLKENRCVALNACKHVFHINCVQSAFKSKPQCPICRVSIGKPQGKSPSGTMLVTLSSIRCSGFRENSIVITYNVPSGRQLTYHDTPHKHHGGKYVTAYLPNTSTGQDLLKRLKFAWLHGLTFTVGTSMTTGIANQVTWASIHHKTSPVGGARAHGYPDPDYFENCNSELDGLGVPSARELDDEGSAK